MKKYWVQKFTRQQRFIFLIVLVWVCIAYFGREMAQYIGAWTLILFLLFPEIMSNQSHLGDKTKDMLKLLSVDGSKMRIGMEWVERQQIRKIALDEIDETYAIMQFPYTNKVSTNYLFPKEQLPEVKAWLETYAPEIELIR